MVSLVVTPGKNLWHCFGCGVGGGPIDWVIKRQRVSFRHAVELLREGVTPLAAEGMAVKRSSVRALPPPVAFDADDQALLNQTVGYYHERLLATTEAAEYLAARGLAHPELATHFKLGVADRTLGLRLPEKSRKAGADIRAQLQKVGLIRDSGHEHFNGSLVVPVFDEAGNVVEVYGRKLLDNLRAGTKRFNQQVSRNRARFPEDFMFQLSDEEFAALRLQSATLDGGSKTGRGQHRKYLPYAFTEHGAIMAATLLNSPRATALSIYVVRAFVELRGLLSSNKELAIKVHALERKVTVHERNIAELADSMAALLATPAPPPKRPIGFINPEDKSSKKTSSQTTRKT